LKTVKIGILLLLTVFLTANLQAQLSKKQHHIYIWDVTLSMKGYNNAPDIYNDVVDVMVKSLAELEEDGSDIIILPFQDKVLQTYKVKATPTGIEQAIDFVKNFNNENITYTNICIAWEKAIQLIDPRNKNIIYLFTDGAQSDLASKGYPKDCLNKVIDQYCSLINSSENAYTFYISMTDKLPNSFKDKLRNACPEYLRFIEGTPPSAIIDIQPTNSVQIVNLREGDLSFTQYFDVSGTLPESFRYNAIIDTKGLPIPSSSTFKIKENQGKQIVNGKTEFELLISRDDLERMKKNAPEEMTATVYFSKQNLKNLGLENHIIEFAPDRIDLKIRNKREKTLKITLLDE